MKKTLCIAAVFLIFIGLSSWGLMAISHAEGLAISLDRIAYAVGGLAVIVCLAILAFGGTQGLSELLGRLGQSSGAERGPPAGDGAVIHYSSGEADFDGRNDELPPVRSSERNQPFPPDRRAD